MEHPNARLVRDLYAAFAARDGAKMKDLIAEEAAWVVPGKSQLAGEHQGHAGIFSYFARLGPLSEGTYKGELVDVLASDERAVAYVRSSARRGGLSLADTYVLLMDVVDGRIARATLYPQDTGRFDAFWG